MPAKPNEWIGSPDFFLTQKVSRLVFTADDMLATTGTARQQLGQQAFAIMSEINRQIPRLVVAAHDAPRGSEPAMALLVEVTRLSSLVMIRLNDVNQHAWATPTKKRSDPHLADDVRLFSAAIQSAVLWIRGQMEFDEIKPIERETDDTPLHPQTILERYRIGPDALQTARMKQEITGQAIGRGYWYTLRELRAVPRWAGKLHQHKIGKAEKTV